MRTSICICRMGAASPWNEVSCCRAKQSQRGFLSEHFSLQFEYAECWYLLKDCFCCPVIAKNTNSNCLHQLCLCELKANTHRHINGSKGCEGGMLGRKGFSARDKRAEIKSAVFTSACVSTGVGGRAESQSQNTSLRKYLLDNTWSWALP